MWLLLLFSLSAFAGSTNCTNVTYFYGPGDYVASSSDCIIRVAKPSWDPTVVYLPSSSEFTVEDDSDYETDFCEGDICYPGGVTVQSLYAQGGVTVDNAISTTLAGEYYSSSPYRQGVQLTWDWVSNWNAGYFHWR